MDPNKLTEKSVSETIYIATDKHGLEVQGYTIEWLKERGYEFELCGASELGTDAKLEDFIPVVARKVASGTKCPRGILICGTGIGVAVGANRFKGIRANLANSPEQAAWSRRYDDCNILCLKGWGSTREEVVAILEAFSNTDYDGNIERRKMLNTFDSWN